MFGWESLKRTGNGDPVHEVCISRVETEKVKQDDESDTGMITKEE